MEGNPRERQFGIKFVFSGPNRGEASARDAGPSLELLCLQSSSFPHTSSLHHAGYVPPPLDAGLLGDELASLCFDLSPVWPRAGPLGDQWLGSKGIGVSHFLVLPSPLCSPPPTIPSMLMDDKKRMLKGYPQDVWKGRRVIYVFASKMEELRVYS